MKIIITSYFEKVFKKVCTDISLDFLIKKINFNSKNFISIKTPFFKVKIKSNSKTYRLILNYERDLLKMLFIDIYDKKDKKIGENLNWNLHEDIILKSYEKNLDAIEKGDYKIFN